MERSGFKKKRHFSSTFFVYFFKSYFSLKGYKGYRAKEGTRCSPILRDFPSLFLLEMQLFVLEMQLFVLEKALEMQLFVVIYTLTNIGCINYNAPNR